MIPTNIPSGGDFSNRFKSFCFPGTAVKPQLSGADHPSSGTWETDRTKKNRLSAVFSEDAKPVACRADPYPLLRAGVGDTMLSSRRMNRFVDTRGPREEWEAIPAKHI